MINIGIIGVGKMGMIHADLIKEVKNLRLIAACDVNMKVLENFKKAYNVEIFTDIDRFLDIKDIDYVVVAATNDVHEKLTIKAIEKGKNVILEKPMSTNYRSTLEMIKTAEKNSKNLFVHHSRRWDRDFLRVKEIIDSKILGNLLLIQSSVMLCDEGWPAWGIEGMANPWRIKKKYGGGILFDWGTHLVDQLFLLVGKDPIGVYGRLQKGVWSKEVEDYFFANIYFGERPICQVEAGNNSLLELPRWYVVGTKGTLLVKGRNIPVWDEINFRYKKDDKTSEISKIKLEDVSELSKGFYNDLVLYLDGKRKNFISMYQASKVVKVLDLIKESDSKNQFIKF